MQKKSTSPFKTLAIGTLICFCLATTIDNIIHRVSWYGGKHQGRLTASGKRFNKNDFTCAANYSYKFGDSLDVTNLSNGKCVTVVVTDRGGFMKYGRTLDLSEAAFSEISDLDEGVINVSIKKIN